MPASPTQNGKHKRKQDTTDARILSHIELETKRVKDTAEALLYDLLPAAISVATEGDTAELTWEESQGFAYWNTFSSNCKSRKTMTWLEQPSYIPVHCRSDWDVGDAPQVCLDPHDRKLLANVALHPKLLHCVMDFLYRPGPEQAYQFLDSLPMQLRFMSDLPRVNFEQVHVKVSTRGAVAALLEGATPLHAAALRGNPAQIDHLLFCKADPMARTAAGDSPLELVPTCEEQPSAGLKAWLSMALLSLACLFGVWTPSSPLHRPVVQNHEAERAQDRRAELSALAASFSEHMSDEAAQGKQHLMSAKEFYSAEEQLHDQGALPVSNLARSDSCCRSETAPHLWADSRQTSPLSSCCGSKRVLSRAVRNADSAFDCFARALKALQDNMRTVQKLLDPSLGPLSTDLSSNVVSEEEQADIYCCWAEAALLKYRGCLCTGCEAIATQAIRLSYFHTSRLFSITEKKRSRMQSTHKLVGTRLARVLHAQMCLLLQSHAQPSATHSIVLHAQLSLQEWDSMIALGLAASAELETSPDVAALHAWVQTAGADLKLAEAFLGVALGPDEPLDAQVPSLFVFDAAGQAFVTRRIDKETAQQLDAATQAAEAASPHLHAVARQAAANAVAEVQSAAALQEVMAGRLEAGPLPTIEELSTAIHAAARFPNLKEDVVFGQQLRDRWERRNETMQQLQKVMQDVCGSGHQLPPGHGFSQADYEECSADWMLRMKELEQAIEQARETELSISMQKAKKILRELQIQAAAADAAASLAAALQHQPCKPAELRTELSNAEAANSTAACTMLCDVPDMLTPLIQHAKAQLHTHSVTEALYRATKAAKTAADLPELDSAISAAQEAGLHELLSGPCRRASELRSSLNYAAEAKAALQKATDSLQKRGQPEHAAALQGAIQVGEAAGDVLGTDVAHAKVVVARWHAGVATEAKLNSALRDCTSAQALGRAIQEASAIGLKVGDARKVLKLMQALEATLQQEDHLDALAAYDLLQAKVEAAEQGAVPASCIALARPRLLQLLMLEVKQSLDAALKPKVGQPMALRASGIRSVLDRAEGLISHGFPAGSAAFLESARPSKHSATVKEAPHKLLDSLFPDGPVAVSAAAARNALMEAYTFLAMEAEEAQIVQAQRIAEQKAKQEQRRLERAYQDKLAKAKAEKERSGLLEKDRQRQADKERAEAELKQQMFRMERSDNEQVSLQEGASSPWRHVQSQQQHTDGPASPQLPPQAPQLQRSPPQLTPPVLQLKQPSSLMQEPSPKLQQPSPQLQHPSPQLQQPSTQLQQPSSHLLQSSPQLQHPSPHLQQPRPPQLHLPALQDFPHSQPSTPSLVQQHAPLLPEAFRPSVAAAVAPHSPAAEPTLTNGVSAASNISASHWLQSDDPKAGILTPDMQVHQQPIPQEQAGWDGRFWRLDVARPSSCTYDAYDSVSERQSEAASSSIYRPAGRQPNRSTSLRSSAASSDGLCSPGNPRHAHTGASSVHSYFTGGPNASAPDRLAPAFDAEPVGSSQSIFSNQDYGLGLDAQRQTLSPEAGTERSGSSFSSGVTGRLTYADLGGAAWGAPLDAKAGASLVPPVTSFPAPSLAAFGPVGSKQASSGNGISQLWAPDSPGTDAAVLSHKQQRHKREVSLSDLGYLGFVSRNEHTAAPASQQSQAVPVYDQVATDSAHASPAPRTLKVQRRCRFYSTGFCKWGNTCKFSHDRPHGPVTPEAPAASATGVTSRSVSGVVAQAANLGNTTGYTTSDARPLPNSSLTQSYGMHTLAANLQQEAFSPPFEFKTRYSMSSTMQPGVTASAVSPIVSPGTGSNIWSATDIANSSPFPGVGSGLPKKFAP